jgi:hypothetical protein
MQAQDPYSYVAPNENTIPRHKRIREAQIEARTALAMAVFPTDLIAPKAAVRFGLINDACKNFAVEISTVCPPSADRSAAERCVRLARMLANEAILGENFEEQDDLFKKAKEQLMLARMQACASIALALPNELPPLS